MIYNFEKDRFHIYREELKNCPNFLNHHHENMKESFKLPITNFTIIQRMKTNVRVIFFYFNIFENKKHSPSRYSDYPQASRVQTRVNQARTRDQPCCTASLFLTEPSNRQTNAFTTDF